MTKHGLALTVRKNLYRLYWAVQARIAPEVVYAQVRYEEALTQLVRPGCSWLDIGCGWAVFPEWRGETESQVVEKAGRVVGIDLEPAALARHRSIRERYVADADRLPFRDQSFDLVTANMVVEHLAAPEVTFAEIRRVLRPGGRFLFHTPNRRCYMVLLGAWLPDQIKNVLIHLLQGRAASDVFPTFYRANTPEAVREAAASAGLKIHELRLIESTPAFALVLPIAVIELLWIRATLNPRLERWRHNIIASLEA